jgi:DNA-directed RNA polymerase subunit M/transcription elongation factor TFIIS
MYGDNDEFVGHVFFGEMLNIPLFDLLENDGDEEKISKYIHAISLMFNINNPYIMNILDVTIFEYLSDSKKVWNKLGEYLPADIIKYINNDLIRTNIAMTNVEPILYNIEIQEKVEYKIIDRLVKITYGQSFNFSDDERFFAHDVINWLSLEYKRYLYAKKGKKDLRNNLYLDEPKLSRYINILNQHNELNYLFEINNNYFKFKESIDDETKLLLEKKAFMQHVKYVHVYKIPIINWKDDNLEINKVLFDLPNVSFPAKCPICGEKEYHMYMARFDKNDNHGSGWVWCSKCKNYSHYQYLIPDDYDNCPAINDDNLESEPSYLNDNKDIIDSWINKYYNSKQ